MQINVCVRTHRYFMPFLCFWVEVKENKGR